MQLYKKHLKPRDQKASAKLIRYLAEIEITDKPIADIACGYGRNGAYLAALNHPVIFMDMDNDCLQFIAEGKNVAETGDIPLKNIKIMNVDLTLDWPFPKESLGGIICVHFYYPNLISRWISSIGENGFFYFETIDARTCNASMLPYENEIRDLLKSDFEILHYTEREVKNAHFQRKKVACCAFATKKIAAEKRL